MRERVFFFLAAALVVLGISGCGGEGKSSDPLGTDSLAFGDTSGSAVLKLDTNGVVNLTAKVKDAAGKPVGDREVFFDVVPNASGATLNSTKVVTNAAGEATILYRAGASPGIDTVRAFISNGVRVDVSITVGGGVAGMRISLAAAPASLATGQSSILTATVTNSTGTPLKGQAVTFSIGNNNSAASLVTVNGLTDVSGKALAVYTAGAANPRENVQDTVQAAVTGSADAVVITRTADGSAGGINVSIASSATSLAAGQIAVITATVTDGASAPLAGRAVTFTFSTNNSGATLTVLNGTTDVSGRAVAQYTAGPNSPTTSVQDTVLASAPGAAAAIVITRTVGTGIGFQIAATATPTSLVAGAISIITATVTNADGTAAPGQQVTFEFIGVPSAATLTPINGGITDVSGKALAVYRAGAANPTESVQDVILARVAGTAAAVVITRQASSISGNRISLLTANPASLPATGTTRSSDIQATVIGGTGGVPIAGVTVNFIVVSGPGTVESPKVTGNDGKAKAIFTGSSAGANQSVVRATIDGGDAVVIITWGP